MGFPPLFWVELMFKRYKDGMIFCVFIFIFCLETTVREQLDESDFRHYYGNFLKVPFWNYLITAMFKVLSQQHLKDTSRMKILWRWVTIGANSFLNSIFKQKSMSLQNYPSLLFEEHCSKTCQLIFLLK